MKFYCSYLLLKPADMQATVTRVAENIKALQKKLKFDAIAVRGVSGYSIGFPVSFVTGIPILVIRKETNGHHGNQIEADSSVDIKKYIILDDFVETGTTINDALKTMNEYVQNKDFKIPKCVGIALYSTNWSCKSSIYGIKIYSV